MKQQKINKEATVQNILDWANLSNGRILYPHKLEQIMQKDNWEEELKEIACFCGTEVVYEN